MVQPIRHGQVPHDGARGHKGQRTWLDACFEYQTVVIAVGRQVGKALDVDTKVPTPYGWRRMGDIRTGGLIFDERGVVRRVAKAHPVMLNRPCYEVEFSDGAKIVADGEHLWTVHTKKARKARRNRFRVVGPDTVSTESMIRDLYVKCGSTPEANYAVSVAGAVQYAHRDLPVHPYVLGLWLGDGHSASAILTAGLDDCAFIKDQVLSCGETVGDLKRDKRSNAATIRIGGSDHGIGPRANRLQTRLRTLGVLNNKHIPVAYMQASVEQRTALLQGLMDTDGCIDKRGLCEFSQVSPVIASQVLELLRGLGFKPTMNICDSTLYGRVVGLRNRIYFNPGSRPVFRMPRKLARQAAPTRNSRTLFRWIVAIRPVESRPVRCLTVESPSGLYLVSEHFIPTHNTTLDRFLFTDECAEYQDGRYVAAYMAQGHPQAREMYEMCAEDWDAAKILKRAHGSEGQDRYLDLLPFGVNSAGGRIWFWSGDPTAHQGAAGKTLNRGVIDEASLVCRAALDQTMRPMFNATRGKLLIHGSPYPEGIGWDWFREQWMLGDPTNEKRDPTYISFNAPSECNPFSSAEWIATQRSLCGDKTTELAQYDGLFVKDSGAVFSNFDAVFTIKSWREEGPTLWIAQDYVRGVHYVVGIDYGKHKDFTVVTIFRLDTCEQVALMKLQGDLTAQYPEIERLVHRYGDPWIYVEGREGAGAINEVMRTRHATRMMEVKWSRGGRWDKESSIVRAQDFFARAAWKMMAIQEQMDEFRLYMKEPIGPTSTGWRYQAPSGKHDDYVAAACYACYGLPLVTVEPRAAVPAIEFGTEAAWEYMVATQHPLIEPNGYSLRGR